MRIGIDARLLAEPLTGIGRYTQQMSLALARLQPDACFHLYSPRPFWQDGLLPDNIHCRSGRFHSRPARMLWSQTCLPHWAKKDRVDIFWGPTHRLPRYLPARIAKVVTIHDLVWKHAGDTMRPLSRWLESRLMPEAVAMADRIVADSSNTATEIRQQWPQLAEKVHTVYPAHTALPTLRTAADALPAMGIDKPYVLFVGTLEPRKNLSRLLAAFARLENSLREQYLLVIAGGKGWGNIDLPAQARALGIQKNVRMLGYVNDARLATLYTNARFLAMPSLYEGFGLPVLEALACKTPVLIANTASLPEVAGAAGLPVDPLDVDSIRDGMQALLTDDALRQRLIDHAPANLARFGWEKAAQALWAVFEELHQSRCQ